MFRKTLCGLVLLLTAPFLLGADNAPTGADWPQFRGPQRDGVSRDTGLLKEWPKNGPSLLWEARGAGRGYSSVAIAAGRIYTMGDAPSTADDKDEYLLCFEEASGKQLWKARLGPAWTSGRNESWKSSRSTPTLDGSLVFVLTPHGSLVCAETATGKEVWRKSMQKDFGGSKSDGWGYSESVLIDGDKLLCTPGGEKTLVALNKKTGATLWTASVPKAPGAGHASIVIAEVGKTRVYVQTTGGAVCGVRASDGKVQWTYPFERATAVIPTPIIRGDLVFFSVGYNRGGALLRQSADADGGVKMEEVYPLKTALQNKHGGVVLVGDYLYGDTGDSGTPFCAALMTGEVKWKQRGSGSGSASVTAADGYLYIRYANGTMALAKASPDGYKEISSFKVPHSGDRPSWSHPVVAGGKLFLREGDYLLCYDLRAK